MSKYFTVEARSILALGRESIKDATTALVELVKNSYDADAENVEIEVSTKTNPSYIRVADNGSGMKKSDVEFKWLRIGFSDKADETNKTTPKGRRKTGEKGIGRLSADRLGDRLILHAKVASDVYGLEVNWKHFEKRGRALHQIPLSEIDQPEVLLPTLKHKRATSGVELIIKSLRDDWRSERVLELKREISLLISPFKRVADFKVFLKTDIEDVEDGPIEPEVAEDAVVSLDARYETKTNRVKYKIQAIGDEDVSSRSIPLAQFSSNQSKARNGSDNERHLRCGDVRIRLLFYPIKAKVFDGISLDKKRVQEFIKVNAGIKIYRDDVWVKPYGEIDREEWDWLNLGRRYAQNPAGAARASFRIRPQNIVGAIFITRDGNKQLADSAAREGLIKGDAFTDLKDFAIGCVRLLETEYHQRFEQDRQEKKQQLTKEVRRIAQDATVVLKDMQRIAPMIARSKMDERTKSRFDMSLERMQTIAEGLRETRSALSQIEEQNILFRGLATIGISTAVFGHEIQSSITSLLTSASFVKDYVSADPPNIAKAKKRIERVIALADTISNWGTYALTRVQRHKRQRRREDIGEIVNKTIDDLSLAFISAEIDVERDIDPLEGRIVAMDVEAILINLLTNAYNACLQETRRTARVKVALEEIWLDSRRGFSLIVSDTGPGVAEEFRERIWTPLFSTKSEGQRNSGTGLGLSIIDSIVRDSSGTRDVSRDRALKGARFEIWLPLAE